MKCENPDCRREIRKGEEAYYHGRVYCQKCWRIKKYGRHVIYSWRRTKNNTKNIKK